MKKLDVYDFDDTIYNGDSSIDFLLYAVKKKKQILIYFPKILIYMLLSFLHIVSIEKFKEVYFEFVKKINNVEKFIDEFWTQKEGKINQFFLENIKTKEENYIISASPEFLLKPYISKFNNVKLIATKFDNNGKIIGKNCKGEEKVKLIKEEEKDFVIDNFYTDSITDLPLVNISNNSYLVSKGTVENWNTDNVKRRKAQKISKLLFWFFLVFYLMLGIQLTFNYNISKSIDLLFDSDTRRVIYDMTEIFEDHFRVLVHPLAVIIIQPIFYIVNGITHDKMLALILMSSVVSAISVMMIYKLVSLLSDNGKLNLLLAMCYGFCFSNFIFTAGIELYNIATLFLILFWYFVIKKIKSEWEKSDFTILIALGILSLAITITNYIVFLIGCLTLLISKKISFKKLLLANIIVIALFLLFCGVQKCIWRNVPFVTEIISMESIEREESYIDYSFGLKNIKNVIGYCFYDSIIGTDVGLTEKADIGKEKIIVFQKIRTWNFIIISTFFITICIFTLKNFKKNLSINIGIILSLIFNFTLHLIYGNDYCFLYSLHFIYLIFLLFGTNCFDRENKRINKLILLLLIVLCASEVIINIKVFMQVLNIESTVLELGYFIKYFSFYETIVGSFVVIIAQVILFNLICYCIKKISSSNTSSEKYKYLIFTFVFIILFESVFALLLTTTWYNLRLNNFFIFK